MRVVSLCLAGRLLQQKNRATLMVRDWDPAQGSQDLVFLRFALIARGPGDHIFPAFVLDDWGRERRSTALYAWVRENGDRFPRAEIFGYEQDGRETQCFLRELELYARLPCYAYTDEAQPVPEGVMLEAILLVDELLVRPERIQPPAGAREPLPAARLAWWKVPGGFGQDDLTLLTERPDAGY